MKPKMLLKYLPLCALVAFAGCSAERFPTAELTGRVTIEGKPLEGVVVQFEPRQPPNVKKALPAAFGITDADGRYRAFRTGNKKFGAVVGVNQVRVVVPEGNTAKVHPRYGQDRAFWAEVAPGDNVFDLELVNDPTASRLRSNEPPGE